MAAFSSPGSGSLPGNPHLTPALLIHAAAHRSNRHHVSPIHTSAYGARSSADRAVEPPSSHSRRSNVPDAAGKRIRSAHAWPWPLSDGPTDAAGRHISGGLARPGRAGGRAGGRASFSIVLAHDAPFENKTHGLGLGAKDVAREQHSLTPARHAYIPAQWVSNPVISATRSQHNAIPLPPAPHLRSVGLWLRRSSG